MRRPLTILCAGLSMLAWSAPALTAASPDQAPQQETVGQPAPASRPASEIVLVRVGDTVITQADFDAEIAGRRPERTARRAASILQSLIGQRLLSLYLEEHPELLDEEEINQKIQQALKAEGVETVEQMRAKLREKGLEHNVDGYLRTVRIMSARDRILKKSDEKATDEYLEEVFNKDPSAFNGARKFVRQIRTSKLPWDTPAELAAKREKMENIRADLISGRRSWDQCVVESDCPSKSAGGEVGYVPRYMEQPPVVGEAAFRLEIGQTSAVLEDRHALYIIQVTKEAVGKFPFERVKPQMKIWAHWEPLRVIEREMLAKHPVVGVRKPDLPPLATQPELGEAEPVRPSPGGRPRATTRPSIRRPATAPSDSAGN